jgi:CRP-like cAMP-binding protein
MKDFEGTFLSRRASETVVVLGQDRALCDAVPDDQRDAATRASVARVIRVALGRWDARVQAEPARGGQGLLILDGLLVRQVGLSERVASELLGPGDLLRPFEHDGEEATLPFAAAWRVLDPVHVAVLDRRWTARMCAFPDVAVALTGRAMARSRRLANMFVIAGYPHLEDRLWLLLWELADRYGTVRRDGVHVPVVLTHQVLSELAAARRPSVTSALSRLANAGSVQRVDDGWLLHGEPPSLEPPSAAALRPGAT